MKCFKIVILMFTCLLGHEARAQVNIQQIKSDTRYWSAEGSGVTVEEADHDALAQITRQISVSITSHHQEKDDNGQFSQSGFVGSFSFASLQNVEMIVLEPEPNAKVFRWVAKSEVEKMFEERKNKILDFVNTGKAAESRLQIDDALRNYYWALMLAKASQSAVYVDFNGEKKNCSAFLPTKIKSVLSSVKVNVEGCTHSDNRYYAQMRFTYDNRDVASIQLRYFDGQSYIGPLTVRDGIGELDLLSLPADGKLRLRYEYSFRKEAENLDAELRSVFAGISAPAIDNALVEIPTKYNAKSNVLEVDRKQVEKTASTSAIVAKVPSETIEDRKRMELPMAANNDVFEDAMRQVENAIKQGTPQSAYPCFTPEGYQMFNTLLTKTGNVSLVGEKQKYEFVQANGQILGRFCKVKIKFKNGKSFMENLVFRFNGESKKIQSVALALTKKAEDDIFNAASSWTEISRFTILQFMEDYQTAYALKRLDYIEKIFSEDAIIITGTVLKTATPTQVEGTPINFGHNDVSFTRMNKQQYISKLRNHFKDREYIHLTFEDNQTKVINAPRIPTGTAFAIQINQIYNSPVYSDRGYLTLVLDASKELPIIHVRLWQPEKSDMMTLDEFMNKFEF